MNFYKVLILKICSQLLQKIDTFLLGDREDKLNRGEIRVVNFIPTTNGASQASLFFWGRKHSREHSQMIVFKNFIDQFSILKEISFTYFFQSFNMMAIQGWVG